LPGRRRPGKGRPALAIDGVGYVDTTPPLELRDGKWLIDAIGDLNK